MFLNIHKTYTASCLKLSHTVGVNKNCTLVFVNFSAQDASILEISVPIVKRRSCIVVCQKNAILNVIVRSLNVCTFRYLGSSIALSFDLFA